MNGYDLKCYCSRSAYLNLPFGPKARSVLRHADSRLRRGRSPASANARFICISFRYCLSVNVGCRGLRSRALLQFAPGKSGRPRRRSSRCRVG